MAIPGWPRASGVEWHCTAPEKSTQNAVIECLSGRIRVKLLNGEVFTSLAQARQALRACKKDYNTVRPHSALGNSPPAIYAATSAPEKQRAGSSAQAEGSVLRPVVQRPRTGEHEKLVLLSNG